jgi:hypothetical protein
MDWFNPKHVTTRRKNKLYLTEDLSLTVLYVYNTAGCVVSSYEYVLTKAFPELNCMLSVTCQQ